MTETTSKLAKAAGWYADHNIFIFPVHSINATSGYCDCSSGADCRNPGKHPRTQHGLKDATTDPEKVSRWWQIWPHANIGIACEPTGWAVIDVDVAKGGDESLHDLETTYGKLPDTVRAITGGNGAHIIFTLPSYGFKSAVAIAPGIDTRGTGGYIVASPSHHISGGSYQWEADRKPGQFPLAAVPLWFLTEMERSSEARRETQDNTPGAIIPDGMRDNVLASLAGSMRARGHTESEMYAALSVTNQERVRPPLPDADIRRIAASYATYPAGKGSYALSARSAASEHAEGLAGRELIGVRMREGKKPTAWLIENMVVYGRIHMLYGEPETGKTIILLSWMLTCIEDGLHVLYIDEESGIDSVAGLLLDMGADPGLIDQYIHYFPFPGIDETAYAALLDYAANLRPAMVAFDSLTDMLTVANLDENNGNQVTSWMLDVATAIARSDYQPAVVLVDHVPKDTENVRYSVASRAKKAKADVLWYVRKLSDFDRLNTAKVELDRHKNRPGVLPKQITYTLGGKDGRLVCRPFDLSQDVVETRHPDADRFVAILAERGPQGRREMAEKLGGISDDTVTRIANELEVAGIIERVGSTRNQRYRFAASGELRRIAASHHSPQNSPQKRPPLGAIAANWHGAANTTKTNEEKDIPKWWT